MLEVRVVLTDEEAKKLKKLKGEMSWRDFILDGRNNKNSNKR